MSKCVIATGAAIALTLAGCGGEESYTCWPHSQDDPFLTQMEEKAAAADYTGTEILLLGDSNTDYWNKDKYCLPAGGGESQCSRDVLNASLNLGVGGATCTNLNEFFGTDGKVFKDYKAGGMGADDWVFFVCGGNDLYFLDQNPEHAKDTLATKAFTCGKEVLNQIATDSAWGDAKPRILVPSLGREVGLKEFHEYEEAYDKMMKENVKALADAGTAVTWVDMAGFVGKAGNGEDLYDADKVHFNAKGYKLWNEALMAAMRLPRNCAIVDKDLNCEYPASAQTRENAFAV